ncbi:MAG: ABC transporter ATP-binding protein/permease [Natronospirillum sp.]|uniref:ABC transporter ATP-binding protein n=1 Tax=Natronospirillum sp. TaxID=2812955 RepID=UPI0025F4C7D0|nr:ABC transporter ATP-binding protein [Natronospirillum sp.]MCH8550771.1 ABC transporter ATP-binding protein/permease [Natronospirillum sp.]
MLGFFERLIRPFPPEEPKQPPDSLVAFCRHYTRGMEGPLLMMSTVTVCVAVLEVMLFGFMGQLVDWLSTSERDTFLQDEGWKLAGMAFLLLVVMPALTLLRAAIVHQTLLGNYPMVIRWLAHRYLLKQSLSFYQNDFAGRIATKVMQTSLSIRETVVKLLDVLVFIIVYFITMVVLLAQLDWRLAVPMVVWLVLYVGVQLHFVPQLKQVSEEQADARSIMTGRVVDSYTNIQTVKLFAHTEREADYAQRGMGGFLDTVYRQMRLVTGINFSVEAINYGLAFVVAALSIWLWLQEAVSVGAIAVAIALALRMNGMAQWIMWEISALFENIGNVNDGMNTIARPRDVLDEPQAPALTVPQGRVEFRQVRFHYGKEYGVFDDLNLDIRPGEKVGLVGRSGAGKSTLVNLLLRFHDVERGQIMIDGQDISQVSQDSLRAQIGMVTQDTSLLHRSVRDNILYGRPDASEQELLNATRQAEAHEFIPELTDPYGQSGYDAMVGERGVKLSGGQRQRIAIARVLLKDAPILVLDEATSALDSEVEAAIQKSLNRLMEGKTVIAIAHRLSTIMSMDRLIVLDQGRIVEMGTHQELVNGGGIYAQLWAHQTGGFLGEE